MQTADLAADEESAIYYHKTAALLTLILKYNERYLSVACNVRLTNSQSLEKSKHLRTNYNSQYSTATLEMQFLSKC